MDKLKMQSNNIVKENIKKLENLFPNCITEGKDDNGKVIQMIDFDMLKQELSTVIIEGDKERYMMTWPDKKQAILTANAPIGKTLRPCKEESVDFDNTQNLYIEGDNLDVLKLLRETYLNKVKMIYIDPPYNTGKDFVYEDDFAIDTEEYLQKSNQIDEQGNRMVTNNDSNGRFHTDWLNMIYPRLKVAKDLLTDDGAIFISIDDNEQENLKKVCDEVFGESNFVSLLSIENNPKGRKNGKFFSINNEFCYVYSKNYNSSEGFVNVVPKTGLLKDEYGYYTHGKRVLVGPSTNNVLKDKNSDKNYTVYYNQETNGVILEKNNINLFNENLFNSGFMAYQSNNTEQLIENTYTEEKFLELYKSNSLIFKESSIYEKDRNIYSQQKTLIKTSDSYDLKTESADFKIGDFELKSIFSNPKNIGFLKMLVKLVSGDNFITLDFFSGSATTAHAVMQLNAEDGGNRKFIMVQLPELTDEKSEAYKAGYKNICEIGKERIRRAGAKIQTENPMAAQNLDIGFRVLKLDSSNMKDVYYNPSEYNQDLLERLGENIKEDRTAEDLLFQVMLDMGVLLSSEIRVEMIQGKKVFNVNEGNLICCFDKKINEEIIAQIAKQKPLYAVFRDSSLENDTMAVNFDQIFETYSPTTIRKVL
jgi:adenine-specific DNA-methyltransferase